jgi:hypothetical protein
LRYSALVWSSCMVRFWVDWLVVEGWRLIDLVVAKLEVCLESEFCCGTYFEVMRCLYS